MEWTDKRVLTFIDEYRKRPVLWDSAHPLFKFTLRKNEAWNEILEVMKLECDILELKRKMTSLLASFRRERQKYRNKELENEPFESTWFAFKSFSFLYDKFYSKDRRFYPQNQMFETHFIMEDEIKVKTEIEDNPNLQELSFLNEHFNQEDLDQDKQFVTNDDSLTSIITSKKIIINSAVGGCSSGQKRKITELYENEDGNGTEAAAEEESSRPSGSRDRFDAFGDYIACHLRELDKKSCAYLMKKINDLLFDVDMGKKFKK